MRNIWENAEDKLDPTKLDEIYTKLELLTHAGQSVKLSHIENIQSRYQKAESPQYSRKTEPAEYQENNQVCPRCGGKLILRTAKKGANAGNHFYGCSNFPKCRYVCNAEE